MSIPEVLRPVIFQDAALDDGVDHIFEADDEVVIVRLLRRTPAEEDIGDTVGGAGLLCVDLYELLPLLLLFPLHLSSFFFIAFFYRIY